MWGKKPKRVYVLGAGPAGLLAAHAAESKGYEVVIFTAPDFGGTPRKSELWGCQYLHEPIPGVTGRGERAWVSYELAGDVEAYRAKVYGDAWQGSVSPDEFGPEEPHAAWSLRNAYDRLWTNWLPRIVPNGMTPQSAVALAADKEAVVLCSVPAPALCLDMENHKFPSQSIWAMGSKGLEDAQQRLPYVAPDNTVLCNGNDAPRWYRAATVFGHSTLEWPAGKKPPISGVAAVSKPLSTECTCHLGDGSRWLRVGRFGQWKKGVLVHTAYFDVMGWLK